MYQMKYQPLSDHSKLRQPKLMCGLAVRAKGGNTDKTLCKLYSLKHTEGIMIISSTILQVKSKGGRKHDIIKG